MNKTLPISRRRFLATTAAASAGALLTVPQASGRPVPASDRIALGFIGVGMMGRGHLGRFLGYDDVQVVAICEIEKTRRETALQRVETKYAEKTKSGCYQGCDSYTDFRELLARPDIDAVVISTPDHWHAIPCLRAAAAKKDIYCEKPLTLTIQEGRMIVDAVKRHEVVLQTGSQQRSEYSARFRKAVELIWAGRIGKLKTIRVGVGAPAVACDLPEGEAPDDVDWDMWVGPSVYRGYSEVLCPKGIHRHFPAFRKYREYAGGGLADMGAHHFDIAQWALEMDGSGPTRIEPPEGEATNGLKFTYGNGVEMFHGGRSGCTFEGTDGIIYVDRPALKSDPVDIVKASLAEDARRVYPSSNHRRNWIDCIKSRKQPICPPEVGHRTASICHLANIGYWLRRPLDWDPVAEKFTGDDEANALLARAPREPWSYQV